MKVSRLSGAESVISVMGCQQNGTKNFGKLGLFFCVGFIYTCVQANVWCTASRAKKVVVSLTLVALVAAAINTACRHLVDDFVVHLIDNAMFTAVVPVAVLLINVVVVLQVRRSATNAAANLGVQAHHHSTSSNSVVPTVMLVVTSIIYVLLYSVAGICNLLLVFVVKSIVVFSDDTWVVVHKISIVVLGLVGLVYAYNFYIYLITGKQFRSELKKLLYCCIRYFSSSAAAAAAAVVAADAAEVGA